MIDAKEAYNRWADQYDTNNNKTRDLEGVALREVLADISIKDCLEIGCGTGKNTKWLLTKATHITAVDLSEKMLAKAKQKFALKLVDFHQADINDEWAFTNRQYDTAVFSLVLEHIEDLESIFQKLSNVILTGGYVYIGELHPFKQYSGSQARFDTPEGRQLVNCYSHHVSDFTSVAKNNGFEFASIHEYFDDNDRTSVPRILALLLKKI